MEVIQRVLGVCLIGIAIAVAVWFIIDTFLENSFDTLNVWYVLDALMAAGLAVGLAFNVARKQRESSSMGGEAISREYLEANAAFYLCAGITILLLHNWFALLFHGPDELADSQTTGIIWVTVDALTPLVLGATGCAMWRESSDA